MIICNLLISNLFSINVQPLLLEDKLLDFLTVMRGALERFRVGSA